MGWETWGDFGGGGERVWTPVLFSPCPLQPIFPTVACGFDVPWLTSSVILCPKTRQWTQRLDHQSQQVTTSPQARLPPPSPGHAPGARAYPLAERVVPAGQLVLLRACLGQQVLQPGQLLPQELVLLLHAARGGQRLLRPWGVVPGSAQVARPGPLHLLSHRTLSPRWASGPVTGLPLPVCPALPVLTWGTLVWGVWTSRARPSSLSCRRAGHRRPTSHPHL